MDSKDVVKKLVGNSLSQYGLGEEPEKQKIGKLDGRIAANKASVAFQRTGGGRKSLVRVPEIEDRAEAELVLTRLSVLGEVDRPIANYTNFRGDDWANLVEAVLFCVEQEVEKAGLVLRGKTFGGAEMRRQMSRLLTKNFAHNDGDRNRYIAVDGVRTDYEEYV